MRDMLQFWEVLDLCDAHDMRDKHTTFGIVDPCVPLNMHDIRYDFQKKIRMKEKLKKKNLKKGL